MRLKIFTNALPRLENNRIRASIRMEMVSLVHKLMLRKADQMNMYLVISSDQESDVPKTYLQHICIIMMTAIPQSNEIMMLSSNLSQIIFIFNSSSLSNTHPSAINPLFRPQPERLLPLAHHHPMSIHCSASHLTSHLQQLRHGRGIPRIGHNQVGA